MFKFLVLSTVGVMTWLGNISLTNGRLLEFGVIVLGLTLTAMTYAGFQMNKPKPIRYGSDGFEQSRIAFALALAIKYPEYKAGAEYDAYVIANWMNERNILINKPYIKDVRDYYLKNMDWQVFGGRAKQVYIN